MATENLLGLNRTLRRDSEVLPVAHLFTLWCGQNNELKRDRVIGVWHPKETRHENHRQTDIRRTVPQPGQIWALAGPYRYPLGHYA